MRENNDDNKVQKSAMGIVIYYLSVGLLLNRKRTNNIKYISDNKENNMNEHEYYRTIFIYSK